jgi:phospholipase/carboxylesterase
LFSLKERSTDELKLGLSSAYLHLEEIINKTKEDHEVETSQISIVGFSQGSMLATYYGLQSNYDFHSIVSLSGSLPSTILEDLKLCNNNTQYLIFHGEIDDVVSSEQAVQTQNFLDKKKIPSKIILDENCGHSISPLALNGINQLYKSWF